LANLTQLNFAGKVNYVLSKVQYKKRKYKNWLWQLRQKSGLRPPASLPNRLRDIEELNYLAAKKYVPHKYDGQMIFFCAQEEVSVAETLTGWQHVVAGGVEVIYVPGDHQTMIKEPHVQHLAEQLMKVLQRH
jgi:thioesterase domain-containing protein